MNKNNYDFQFLKSYKQDGKLENLCSNVANICNDFDDFIHTFFTDDQYDTQDNPNTAWIYYAMKDSELIGFIATYAYDETNIEICAFVLPDYRRQKIFSRLYAQLTNDLNEQMLSACISENDINAKQFLTHCGFEYESTECMMQLCKDDYPKTPIDAELTEIVNDGFTDFIYSYNGVDIGSCSSYFTSKHTVGISNVIIDERYRGQDHGQKLMQAVLNNVFFQCDTVLLHVTKENVPAYNMYKKLGFSEVDTQVFYQKTF